MLRSRSPRIPARVRSDGRRRCDRSSCDRSSSSAPSDGLPCNGRGRGRRRSSLWQVGPGGGALARDRFVLLPVFRRRGRVSLRCSFVDAVEQRVPESQPIGPTRLRAQHARGGPGVPTAQQWHQQCSRSRPASRAEQEQERTNERAQSHILPHGNAQRRQRWRRR